MPAPVVYVLAIVGTVGAVLAFKEFVYEPHISPAIDRWKLEYQAARRRREAAHASEGDLLMSQTDSRGPDARKSSDNDDDSDDDKPLAELGKGSSRFLQAGLLPRRKVPEIQADVELEDLVAREVSEWRNEDTGSGLRQRKNASENNAMDESLHAIPYEPLSPSRTHVVFDPSAPSTPGSGSLGNRHPSLPHSPAIASGIDISRDVSSPKSVPRSSSPQVTSPKVTSRPTSPLAPLPAVHIQYPHQSTGYGYQPQVTYPTAPQVPSATSRLNSAREVEDTSRGTPRLPLTQSATSATPTSTHATVTSLQLTPSSPSPPPPASPLQQSITQSMLLGVGNSPTPTASTSIISSSTHPLQQSYTVPSLSQSYPQDLDYEHGLELLSPPSSRSESPFSMAGMSPNPSSVPSEGLRALSPIGSSSNMSSSNFSSAVSSPSPLRMGLGNESFDAVSPFLDPTPHSVQGSSVTDSARSTTYLSFPEDSSEDEVDQSHILAPPRMGASIGVDSTFASINPPRAGIQTSPVHFGQFRSMPNSRVSPVSQNEARTSPSSGYFMNSSVATGSQTSSATSFLRPTSDTSPVLRPSNPPQAHHSDADLSDLDLMSDYAPSESDLGNESDSSWSMAGGSAAASPRIGNRNAADGTSLVNVTRGGTIRDSRGGKFAPR